LSATSQAAQSFIDRVHGREVVLGIVGLGYVGIPLALAALRRGIKVVGFDIDQPRVDQINAGKETIKHIPMELIVEGLKTGASMPRPISTDCRARRVADLRADAALAPSRARSLLCPPDHGSDRQAPAPGQLIVLESTTYPGTTDELMRPILEIATGLKSGEDFFLAYSPEREDPGNGQFGTSDIPKVVGGDGPDALAMADALYAALVVKTVPVSSTATAEAVKLTENIFRAVNIALVNELKQVYAAMGIDIWEVIDAAKTKPFGYMPFYPGPGLGGHCIPIDPFYLTWKAREFDVTTRFIELAGQINTNMPYRVVDRLAELVDTQLGRGFSGARILVLGIAYKKNIEDMRESPALKLIELIEARGASAAYHDPHVPEIRRHGSMAA
jgi:UDP-N-acetyl-D-glucosamine dehydrogenase